MKTERRLPPKFLAAMVAVLPLPGSPLYGGNDQRVLDQALADVRPIRMQGWTASFSKTITICLIFNLLWMKRALP